mgnify:CR=1 FL=1
MPQTAGINRTFAKAPKAQSVAEAPGLIQTERIGQAVVRLFETQALIGIYERLLRIQPYAVYGLPESRGE